MTTQTDPFVDWDGAYVLGALSAAERREYEQHLAACPRCTRAVGELAGVPGLLALVPAEDVVAQDGTDTVPSVPRSSEAPDAAPPISLLARRARTSRTRRRLALSVAAAALVVGGGAAGAIVGSSLDDAPGVVAAHAQVVRLEPVDDSGVAADLTLERTAWGTHLAWSCTYPPGRDVDGVEYDLTVIDLAGRRSTVATWTGGTAQTVTGLTAATSLTPDQIDRIEMSAPTLTTPLAAATLDRGATG